MPIGRLGLILALLAGAALTAPAAPAAAATPAKKLLVVGMDGLNWDSVLAANAPTLHALADQGLLGRSLVQCPSTAESASGPGWSTIATGVWPDRHGVRSNTFIGKRYGTYPDFLTRLEQADPSYATYSVVDWPPLHNQGTFSSAVDTRVTFNGDTGGYPAQDENVTADAIGRLSSGGPDASFVYLGNTDVVAHASGTGAAYQAAIEQQDQQLGRILTAVRSRPTYGQEDWLIMVTTDHGHRVPQGGHGFCGIDERGTFLLASGAGISAGLRPIDVRQADVAASALAHFGVEAALDGKSVRVRSTDPFDGLALRTRVDETGIPATLAGWTPDAPAGWSVLRSAMPTGGVTEWRGWSFTTDEFWSRAQAGQERENALRTRGVFAVADSDEFADKTGGSSYDSTLVSPDYPVTAGSTAYLNYVTHYRQHGSQKGDVLVSFNDGPDQLVKRYSADARATVESLPVAVPSGATRMAVKFRYHDAGNNWYWVIDDLRIS
ncbi:phosphopentomutase/2,3-bisphosphoglycerate-independent phosphoglycerate mutase family metalloenzyme [Krasilnikovia cinnamomea]|uniref:Phosphopentomutase/2, 3-bisphosphoglycerate-independent phosphoglycerate mutase family metalloenzyme n=1 Tax=Krasilnikovia cinnamomea TaxID=349313 RepID=A0A4Q7ZT85_9ACTN|nr:alkaline phosphatase family protein [Krasilnikovia cinnamomea]RZU53725.1 phosphopentomutase/2,3-bisphosphoglycerate-independent phosphoglycerate mutase family metalloenzyme [Krasilnikovia cinnamomea]